MKDIVFELKEDAREHLFLEPEQTLQWEAANEIERLREIVNELLPHALFLLTQMEDGLSKDPKLLRDSIQKAREALEEKE